LYISFFVTKEFRNGRKRSTPSVVKDLDGTMIEGGEENDGTNNEFEGSESVHVNDGDGVGMDVVDGNGKKGNNNNKTQIDGNDESEKSGKQGEELEEEYDENDKRDRDGDDDEDVADDDDDDDDDEKEKRVGGNSEKTDKKQQTDVPNKEKEKAEIELPELKDKKSEDGSWDAERVADGESSD